MPPAQSFSLLIADDEQAIRSGIASAIDWEGRGIHVVGLAKDGQEALTMIQQLHPDLVITDIKMPGCTGLEMIEQARRQKLSAHFLILSGYDDFSFAQQAIRNGVASYLLKPVKVETLLEEVDRICETIRAERRSDAQDLAAHSVAHAAEPAMRQQFYSMLAQGEYHSMGEIQNGAARLPSALIQCPCTAAVLRFTLPRKSDLAHFSQTDHYLFRTALRNVAAELADGQYLLECFLERANVLGILLFPQEGAADFLVRCIETMKQISPIRSITAGIGLPAQTLLDIPDSCRTAEEMSEYHMYSSPDPIFDAAQVGLQSHGVPPRPPVLDKLAEAVIAADEAAIQREVEQFFSTICYIPMPPPRYVRGMCAYLLNDVSKRIAALLQLQDPIPYSDFPQKLDQAETMAELRELILDRLLWMASRSQSQKNHLPESIEFAKSYIQSHVLSRLRVEQVAAQVHLSESHFAALFKKSVGITAGEYIFECKIEKAKELLLSRELSIFEIAEALEYSDYRSFSRAFKRFVGCSPTEYQQMLTSPRKKE